MPGGKGTGSKNGCRLPEFPQGISGYGKSSEFASGQQALSTGGSLVPKHGQCHLMIKRLKDDKAGQRRTPASSPEGGGNTSTTPYLEYHSTWRRAPYPLRDSIVTLGDFVDLPQDFDCV